MRGSANRGRGSEIRVHGSGISQGIRVHGLRRVFVGHFLNSGSLSYGSGFLNLSSVDPAFSRTGLSRAQLLGVDDVDPAMDIPATVQDIKSTF